ncbi:MULTISPECIES: endonuclease/exonuclease/phosphatase family protein [Paracoccaceae]|uniref:endonuclease/exonuclease/phosphatase family protein n=1 Tax=Rhodobacterales TaxID=204455 RepID=UPI001B15F36C|nr:endonuclease/exonuclease/phosphatase family protein [Boseongicola sp. H5]MBO6602943.1 endonuclease/exonuclease/phosphatase family protein [Roseicyclus sp.]MBO6625859.1 endonuclease/exonuclease/phosphatase family protein [Roseicyclus sp.]MBO6923976.1 endonuclease/exonuclease/phosphatase family protein [Roseicyclus sp.]
MPRTNRRDLSFATFNLLNLSLPGQMTYGSKPALADDADGREAYARKIRWTAQALQLLDAEVIGFQEVWSAAALIEAFEAAGLRDQYDIIARDAPGKGRPQVALAVRRGEDGKSQLIAGSAEWVAAFPETFRLDGLREVWGSEEEITVTISEFSRPVLRAQIQPTGTRPKPPPVQLFVAHLKSKGPARLSFRDAPPVLDLHGSVVKSAVAHIRRVMEAAALRLMLDAEIKGEALSPVVVLGDLNDDSLSVTTEMISGQPGYRLEEKSTAGSRSDAGLYAVERLQQYRSLRHVYYTHIFRNKMESLDHIMVSEEFYDHARKRQWSFREAEVINDHLNRESKAELAEIGASDHGLVRAYFDWNPMPEMKES